MMETVDEQYKEGFNTGYWLASGDKRTQEAVLDHLIEKQHPEIPYAKGLVAGKKQMEKEKMLAQINAIDNSKESGMERDI